MKKYIVILYGIFFLSINMSLKSMEEQKSYYEILGIESNATTSEIKGAYKKLALKWHPDRNKAPEAEEKFKEIKLAYETLSDPEKRYRYDRLHSTPQPASALKRDLLLEIVDIGKIAMVAEREKKLSAVLQKMVDLKLAESPFIGLILYQIDLLARKYLEENNFSKSFEWHNIGSRYAQLWNDTSSKQEFNELYNLIKKKEAEKNKQQEQQKALLYEIIDLSKIPTIAKREKTLVSVLQKMIDLKLEKDPFIGQILYQMELLARKYLEENNFNKSFEWQKRGYNYAQLWNDKSGKHEFNELFTIIKKKEQEQYQFPQQKEDKLSEWLQELNRSLMRLQNALSV